MTITTWRPRVTEARIKPEPHTWRQAAVIVPLVAGGLYVVVAVAGAARLPWEGVAAAVGLAGFAVVIAAASVTGNGILAGYAAVCGAVACGWVLYAQLTSPWTISVAFALLGPALFLGAGYPVVHGRHRQAIAEANRRAEEARKAAAARKWPDLLARIGAPGVALAGSVETRAGHTYLLRLPAARDAGTARKLMGMHDVRVARVGPQRLWLPASRAGAALGDADLPHQMAPSRWVRASRCELFRAVGAPGDAARGQDASSLRRHRYGRHRPAGRCLRPPGPQMMGRWPVDPDGEP